MSLIKTNRTTDGAAAIGTRAKDAAAQVVPVGKRPRRQTVGKSAPGRSRR